MSRKTMDGIKIDSRIYLSDDKKDGMPVSIRVIQLVAIFLGSLCPILILLDCFSLPVKPSHAALAALISGIMFFFLYLYPGYDLVKLAVCTIAYLIVVYRCFSRLRNAFFIFENYIIKKASSYYNFKAFRYKAQYATEKEDLTLFFVMVIIIVTALLSAAMVRNMLTGLTLIVLSIPIAASFAVGETPREGLLIIFLVIMLYMTRSYESRQKVPFKDRSFMLQRIYSRAAIVLCLMGVVLFVLSKIFVPEERYKEIDAITNTKHEIQDFFYSFSIEDVSDKLKEIKLFKTSGKDTGKGGLSSGKLGRFSEVKYDGDEHLVVKAPLGSISEGIFLRGYVGSEYNHDSWNSHTRNAIQSYENMRAKINDEKIQPANLSILFMENVAELMKRSDSRAIRPDGMEFYRGRIGISYKNANKDFIYAPYLTDFASSDEVGYRYDLYAVPEIKKDKYEFYYYYGVSADDSTNRYGMARSSVPFLKSYIDYEKLYRDFVYETYTRLPVKGLDRLKEDFSRENLSSQADTLEKAVSYIKNYLHSNIEYTLSPGKLPKDKDFVEYFLYESKVGYCTHYASAGALMLRAMGYPSRYVEGYAITTSDILLEGSLGDQKVVYYPGEEPYDIFDNEVTISVKDYNAHAWAEVYIDGFGWFPVEFTPSAAIEGVNDLISDIENAAESAVFYDEPEPTPTEPAPTPTQPPEAREPEVTQAPPDKEGDKGGVSGGGKDKAADNSGSLIWIVIAAASVLFLLLSALILLRVLRKKRRHKSYNRSKRALTVYGSIERLLGVCGYLPRKDKCLEDNLEYVREHCPFVDEYDIEAFMEVANKARFGKEQVSREELLRIRRIYAVLKRGIYHNSSIFRKMQLKLLRA